MEARNEYALVTGASSGIGWYISGELAKKGYNIVAVSNQPEKLDDLKKRLEKDYNVAVIRYICDLAQENSALQIFSFCEEKNLTVEVLINNAGTLYFGEVLKIDYSQMKNIMNVHMSTPASLCHLFLRKMTERKKGFILNTSSISSVMPYPTISVYGPTKAFLRYFTRALRTEVKKYNINVTCLLPGATSTGLYNADKYDTSLNRKLGVMKKPETVAKAGIKALFRNRSECIPGFLNKLVVLLVPVVPHAIIGAIFKRTNLLR
jgi:hypothetical protein